MNDIQKALLALLKEIDAICKKHNIEYYLGGGSQIGAIRHGGFLPWDDDADVHMSRENAYRFIEALEKEGNPERIVYVESENGDYMNTHWRYQNTSSTVLLRGAVGSAAPQGQFIDIFVNYPLPKNPKLRQKCLDDFELYVELKAMNATVLSMRSKKYLRRYLRLNRIGKVIGHKRVLKHLEKKMFYFSEVGAEEWFIRAPIPPQRATPIEWWGKPRYVPFEDTYLPIAEQAEKLLNQQYGPAWFEVPPFADRDEHTFVVDLDVPYTTYTDEYHKYYDMDKFFQYEIKKKRKWFELLVLRNTVNPQMRLMKGIAVSLEVQQFIEQNKLDVLRMLEQKRFTEIECIFEPYISMYGWTSFRYWGTFIDIPDDYLYAALYSKCFNAQYGFVKKLLRLRKTNVKRELSDGLKELCSICDATDELLTALYGDLDFTRAKELCDEWLAKYPELLYFMRANIQLSIQELPEEKAAIKSIQQLCSKYLLLYPDDGELLKYSGDLYFKLGDRKSGEVCYKKALYKANNGFCLKEIKQYFQS